MSTLTPLKSKQTEIIVQTVHVGLGLQVKQIRTFRETEIRQYKKWNKIHWASIWVPVRKDLCWNNRLSPIQRERLWVYFTGILNYFYTKNQSTNVSKFAVKYAKLDIIKFRDSLRKEAILRGKFMNRNCTKLWSRLYHLQYSIDQKYSHI